MAQQDDLVDILAGCRKGNSESFSQLVDIYSSRVYGYFFRLTGNRTVSDDLLGELFVKLVEKIKGFKGGSFEAWLFKVASNIFYDHLRSKQRDKEFLGEKAQQFELENVEERNQGPAVSDELQQNLERLDDETRELIMLRFYGQLSFKELAEMRKSPIGTVLSKVHRGLQKLREFME